MIRSGFDSDGLQYRERDLWGRVEKLQQRLDTLERSVVTQDQLSLITPPMVNLLRNYHIDFTHNSYTGDSYSDGNSQAAHWYTHNWSDTTLYTENTTTTRDADALVDAAGGDAEWSKSTGEAKFGVDNTIDQPLKKLYGIPNSKLYVRAVIKKGSGSVADDLRLYCELWESINGSSLSRICSGGYITGTATKVGAHSGGTETREYVVEAITPYGTFTSDTTTLISVTNCLPIGSAGEANYVSLSWDRFSDVSQYNIYRRISGTVKLIGSVVSGANTFNDRNGAGTAASLPTAAQPVVRATLENFGKLITDAADYTVVRFALYIPITYTLPTGASDKQWLRIGCKNSDGSVCSSGQLAARSMLIDRVSIGYNDGEITPSAEDLTITGAGSASTPPPTGGGPTGGETNPPDGGEGGGTCVTLDQPVLCEGRVEKPFGELKVGDVIAVSNGVKVEYAPISEIHYGVTSRVYTIHTLEGRSISCSPSHPIVACGPAIPAHSLKIGDLISIDNGAGCIIADIVVAIETLDINAPVGILTVDHPAHTFIAGGIVSHNLKILP